MPHYLHHTIIFLKRIGIAFLIFTLCRLLFFVFNFSYFNDVSPILFINALRFDMSAISFAFLPFIILSIIPFHFKSNNLYQKLLKILFHLSNTAVLTLNCIDIEYFKFTLKRTTSDIFVLIGFGKDFISLIPQFAIDFWYVIVIWVVLIMLSGYLYNKVYNRQKTENGRQKTKDRIKKYYLIETPIFLIFLTLFIIGARGGLQLRPVNIINANEYTQPQNIPLVLNTPFTVIKTIFEEGIEEKIYFPVSELEKLYSPVHQNRYKEDFKNLNVVLIIMESFSNEYIGVMNPEIKRETYTPFLDSLARHSLLFDKCYANGKKSIEGIPAIIAALPSLMNNPFISSAYSADEINSLASIPKQKGYQTAFFHGGTNGTMGFDAFSEAAGFDKYFGRNEYNNDADYDGNWGIYDEEFFQFFAKKLNEFKQPFLGCFFSISSHHPFTVPEKYNSRFKDGKLKIHKSIQYADFSLKRFFETASRTKWFENTLFIITSDHTSTTTLPFFNTSAGIYSIPLLFYSPGRILPAISHKITQQTDILPSTLDFLNYNEKFVAFGQSVFSGDPHGFSINYMNNIYQIITEENILQFDGDESSGFFNFKNDLLLKNNILAKDSASVKPLEQKLKAIIQSYNYRLINNKLVEK